MNTTSEKLQRNKAYPLADYHPLAFRNPNIKAVWTGEKRAPKAGEWYLSGAIIEAYQAKNDLTTPYHIAKIVEVTTTTLETFKDVTE